MPVPFRGAANEDAWGLAGFLRFVMEPNDRGMRGALFLVNARGEPIDFSFSRIDIHAPFLWREGDARRAAEERLVKALFQACPDAPTLILALAGEVHARLFSEDVLADAPVCRVASGTEQAGGSETLELHPGAVQLFWAGPAPGDDSPARHLLDALVSRSLITEPFERAAAGISEAFRDA